MQEKSSDEIESFKFARFESRELKRILDNCNPRNTYSDQKLYTK